MNRLREVAEALADFLLEDLNDPEKRTASLADVARRFLNDNDVRLENPQKTEKIRSTLLDDLPKADPEE